MALLGLFSPETRDESVDNSLQAGNIQAGNDVIGNRINTISSSPITGGVYISETDEGAIKESFAFGRMALEETGLNISEALDAAQNIGNKAFEFGQSSLNQALESNYGVTKDAFNFADNAMTEAGIINQDSIDLAASVVNAMRKLFPSQVNEAINDQTLLVIGAVAVVGIAVIVTNKK